MKLRRLIAAGAAAALVGIATLSAPLAHAAGTQITRLDINATYDTNGVLTAKWTIDVQYDSPTAETDFWLPTRIAGYTQTWQLLKYSDITVASTTGAPVNVKTTQHDGVTQLSIGDPANPVSGQQTYVLTYQVTGLLWQAKDGALFRWPIIGSDWQTPISNMTVTLTQPKFTMKPGGILVNKYQVDSLLPNESWGLYPYTYYDNGVITGGVGRMVPRHPTVFGTAQGEQAGVWTAAALTVVALVALALLWRKGCSQRFRAGVGVRGRRAVPSAAVPNGEAPAGVAPYLVGMLQRGSATEGDTSAVIAGLADAGYLRVTVTYGVRTLEPIDTDTDALTLRERQVFNRLFPDGKGADVPPSRGNKWLAFSAAFKGTLQSDLVEESLNPPRIITRYQVVGAAIAVLGTLLVSGVSIAILPGGNGGWGWLAVPLVVFGLGLVLIASVAPMRNSLWPRLAAQCWDLRTYLRDVAKSQLAVGDGPDTFSKYLPYAISLGCAAQWARHFDDLEAQGTTCQRPSWYVDGTGKTPSFSVIAESFSQWL